MASIISATITLAVPMGRGLTRLDLTPDNPNDKLPSLMLENSPEGIEAVIGTHVEYDAKRLSIHGKLWALPVQGQHNRIRLVKRD